MGSNASHVFLAPEARVLGDLFTLVGEDDPIHVALRHDRVVSPPHRDRVVIAIKPHERERTRGGGELAAGVEGRLGKRQEDRLRGVFGVMVTAQEPQADVVHPAGIPPLQLLE